MHGKVVLGIRSAGNVKQSERPTKYAHVDQAMPVYSKEEE
jgi:hypothetical protein